METMSLSEAATYLRIAPSYLRKLCQRRRIAFSKPTGGKLVFLRSDLEAFLTQGRRTADFEDHIKAADWLNGSKDGH